MRYRIKARLAELGMKACDLCLMVNAEGGYNCAESRFSRILNGRIRTEQAEQIAALADAILTRIEKSKKQ